MDIEDNLGAIERWIRMMIGGTIPLGGLLFTEWRPLFVAVGIALVLIGTYLFVTGLTAFCPLNYWLRRRRTPVASAAQTRRLTGY